MKLKGLIGGFYFSKSINSYINMHNVKSIVEWNPSPSHFKGYRIIYFKSGQHISVDDSYEDLMKEYNKVINFELIDQVFEEIDVNNNRNMFHKSCVDTVCVECGHVSIHLYNHTILVEENNEL